jgi:hypothetical protein
MQTKLFELRDEGTFIPIIATLMDSKNEAEIYLLRRTGYGVGPDDVRLVLLDRLSGGFSDCVPQRRGSEHGGGKRTFPTAHQYIQDHWSELVSGQVIDVEYILGETDHPKISEAFIPPDGFARFSGCNEPEPYTLEGGIPVPWKPIRR